jgi:hypothetical protein
MSGSPFDKSDGVETLDLRSELRVSGIECSFVYAVLRHQVLVIVNPCWGRPV